MNRECFSINSGKRLDSCFRDDNNHGDLWGKTEVEAKKEKKEKKNRDKKTNVQDSRYTIEGLHGAMD